MMRKGNEYFVRFDKKRGFICKMGLKTNCRWFWQEFFLYFCANNLENLERLTNKNYKKMKRVFMLLMVLFAVFVTSPNAKAQEISVTLIPGWNWIGFPKTEPMDIAAALGDFVPTEGDIIRSRYGSASYSSMGIWVGSLRQLTPGLGYHYYSNRAEPVNLVFVLTTPQSQVQVTTSEPMLITAVTAMGGGEVTTDDGIFILAKGLCWATHEDPTTNEDDFVDAGSGVGSFSASMTGLNISTTYYVRAYAVTADGTTYGDQKTFTTRDGIPAVSTASVTSITGATASCGGTVTDNGGLSVTARGVCWSTSQNPTISDSHTTNGSGLGSFTSSITGLAGSTIYYVRAYASTNHGTAYGEEMNFTTLPSIVTSVSDIFGDGAKFSGELNYNYYLDCPDGCRGFCWSTSPNPTINDYHSVENVVYCGGEYYYEGDFTVYMTGLDFSTTYYVRAYVNNDYNYNSVEYGNEVCFTTLAPLWPNGVLPGCFSVSSNHQVHFSQGNLQYKASSNTWRFAMNQWNYVGGSFWIDDSGCDKSRGMANCGNVYLGNGEKCNNNSISSDYNGWIDLFGWGTSGYDHGAVCFQPWSISETDSHYYAYGQYTYNLYDQTGQADWGYNPVVNGGNSSNQWKTLTKEEWKYVFNTRSTTSGIRYAKATVLGVNGVILLPDDWNASYYSLYNTNSSDANFYSNWITSLDQWSVLEQHGAVFLPQTGDRHRWDPDGEGWHESEYGYDPNGIYYWSSSYRNSSGAWHVKISGSGVYPQDYSVRRHGYAVRLVQDVE